MKIKDLFKQMEKANEFAKMIGEEEFVLYASINGYSGKECHTFKEFKKWLKVEEWATYFVEKLLEVEIELQGKNSAMVYFDTYNPYFGLDKGNSIEVAIYKRY